MTFKAFLLSLSAILCLLPSQQQAQEINKIILPDMGDSSGSLISPAQERELGNAFYRSLQGQLNINYDTEIQEYIQSIGQRLAANSDAPAIPFYFFVVLDNAINAFAGPGGYIGINSGLILNTESESELASVMAHEIAHVTQRHLYRAFESASQLSLPTAAATLAAILLGTQVPGLGQAALMAIQAGSIQQQINFTRSNEQEADRVGMQTLVQANYDPRSMPVFFQRLQQSSRYYGRGIPEFLRTHPVTVSRISDTRGRAEKYPYKQYPDSQAYRLTKAKLRVLTTKNDNDLLNYFKSMENQGTPQQRAAAHYGIGLSLFKKQHFKKAQKIFTQLYQEFPHQYHYLTGLARIAFETRDYSQALALFKKARQRFPSNRAIELEYISILLKTGHAEQARSLLQAMVQKQKQQNPIIYRLLAQAYAEQGQQAEAHRYMAEYYYAAGNTEQAITQAKLARESKKVNFYLGAILDERLNFFISEEIARKQDH
jgi:beta-barrel assembly-enhancing protease